MTNLEKFFNGDRAESAFEEIKEKLETSPSLYGAPLSRGPRVALAGLGAPKANSPPRLHSLPHGHLEFMRRFKDASEKNRGELIQKNRLKLYSIIHANYRPAPAYLANHALPENALSEKVSVGGPFFNFSQQYLDRKKTCAANKLRAWLTCVSVLAVALVSLAYHWWKSNEELRQKNVELAAAINEKNIAKDEKTEVTSDLEGLKALAEKVTFERDVADAQKANDLLELKEAYKQFNAQVTVQQFVLPSMGVPRISIPKILKPEVEPPVMQDNVDSLSLNVTQNPLVAELNVTLVHPNLTQSSTPDNTINGWQSGKIHIFDIDNDERIKPDHNLAIIARWREADALEPRIFKANVERKPKPLVIQLDPNALFLAARWDYSVTPRRWLLQNKIKIRNPKTKKIVEAQAVDGGPSAKDGHLLDLSPGLCKALGLKQNDEAEIQVPKEPQKAK